MRYPQNELMEKLFRTVGLMNRTRGRGRGMDPMRGQGRVLALLRLHPETGQKELAYLLDMRPQSLSELITKLERRGYVKRTQSQDDKRSVIITITEEGFKAEQPDGLESDPVFDCLSEDEQAKLSEYLDKLIARLEALEEEHGKGERFGREGLEPDGSGRGGRGGWGPEPGFGPGPGRGHRERRDMRGGGRECGREGPRHHGDCRGHMHRREEGERD